MDERHDNALRGCLDVCRRCRVVAETVASSDPTGEVFDRIGPHLRHCLDHFTALLKGLDRGCVDYDARERETALERDPELFLAALEATERGLARLSAVAPTRPIDVIQLPAPGVEPTPIASSLQRELLFLSSHTIHHLALIIHLAGHCGVQLPEELGVAFSTAAWRASQEVPTN